MNVHACYSRRSAAPHPCILIQNESMVKRRVSKCSTLVVLSLTESWLYRTITIPNYYIFCLMFYQRTYPFRFYFYNRLPGMAPLFKTIIKSKYVKKLLPLAHVRKGQETIPSTTPLKLPTKPSVCSICKNLDPNLFEIRELRSPRLRVNCDALTASNNCLSCSLLVKIIQRYFTKFEISPKYVRLVYEKTLCIDFGTAKEIMLYSTQTTPWPSIAIKGHVKGPNSSEESLHYVKQMLQKCSSNHKLCQTDAYLPKRLLDLGPQGHENDSSVRLMETESMEASSANRYVCLSHCWGINQPIRTLKENLNEHLRNIPFEALPRTFIDAIDFTRRLGIRYLWIDSL